MSSAMLSSAMLTLYSSVYWWTRHLLYWCTHVICYADAVFFSVLVDTCHLLYWCTHVIFYADVVFFSVLVDACHLLC